MTMCTSARSHPFSLPRNAKYIPGFLEQGNHWNDVCAVGLTCEINVMTHQHAERARYPLHRMCDCKGHLDVDRLLALAANTASPVFTDRFLRFLKNMPLPAASATFGLPARCSKSALRRRIVQLATERNSLLRRVWIMRIANGKLIRRSLKGERGADEKVMSLQRRYNHVFGLVRAIQALLTPLVELLPASERVRSWNFRVAEDKAFRAVFGHSIKEDAIAYDRIRRRSTSTRSTRRSKG